MGVTFALAMALRRPAARGRALRRRSAPSRTCGTTSTSWRSARWPTWCRSPAPTGSWSATGCRRSPATRRPGPARPEAGGRRSPRGRRSPPARSASGSAPRINAAGRLDDAGRGVRLLLTADEAEARALADGARPGEPGPPGDRAAHAGARRWPTPRRRWPAAPAAWCWPATAGTPAWSASWRRGWPSGSTAPRSSSPSALGTDGRGGKGSGRSIEGFHLYDALAACREHLAPLRRPPARRRRHRGAGQPSSRSARPSRPTPPAALAAGGPGAALPHRRLGRRGRADAARRRGPGAARALRRRPPRAGLRPPDRRRQGAHRRGRRGPPQAHASARGSTPSASRLGDLARSLPGAGRGGLHARLRRLGRDEAAAAPAAGPARAPPEPPGPSPAAPGSASGLAERADDLERGHHAGAVPRSVDRPGPAAPKGSARPAPPPARRSRAVRPGRRSTTRHSRLAQHSAEERRWPPSGPAAVREVDRARGVSDPLPEQLPQPTTVRASSAVGTSSTHSPVASSARQDQFRSLMTMPTAAARSRSWSARRAA